MRQFWKSEKYQTLLGVILIKIGTGIVSSWGSNNIYYISLFYSDGLIVNPSTNSYIMLFLITPMVFVILLATKICNSIGYQRTVKICSLCFIVSPLAIYYKFNIQVVCIFVLFIPGSAFAISSIPVVNCLWTQFPNSRHKMTAIAVVAFTFGTILWNSLFMKLANPQNIAASVYTNNMVLFDQRVTNNVKFTSTCIYLISGLLFVLGSLLIKRDNLMIKQNDTQLQEILVPLEYPLAKITLKNALKDQRFLIIFFVSFLMGLYQFYLANNLKIIYMTIINDDHFLGYCLILYSSVSILGALFWGWFGDHKGFAYSMMIISIVDCFVKMYGNFVGNKINLIILFIMLGITDKGMLTMVGPGLVQIFGLELGTQLLAYKGLSVLTGFVMVPLLQILTAQIWNPQQFSIFLSLMSIIAMILSVRFYGKY